MYPSSLITNKEVRSSLVANYIGFTDAQRASSLVRGQIKRSRTKFVCEDQEALSSGHFFRVGNDSLS